MNYKEFKKLSLEQQNKIQKDFTYYLCELNLPSDEILTKLQIPYSTFRIFKKIFNANRTKEQEYKLKVEARKDKQIEITKKIKQTKLERYGDENYRNDEKRKQTCLEKYGVENPYAAKEIIEKKKQTYLKHYGVEHPMKNKEFALALAAKKFTKDYNYNNPEKAKQTKLERYGDENYHNVDKMKQTNLQKYGTEIACQNPFISKKISTTWKHKTAEEIENILLKRQQTCLEKYGVDNPWKSEEIKAKIKEILLEKYGVYNSWQLGQGSVSKINKLFSSILTDLNIEHSLEYSLANKRYDFKIGNILLEINPTYTHNSTVPAIFAKSNIHNNALPKTYHLEKSQLAKENGFRCIHIWDWDDWDKIINMFIPKETIYARNCKLKEVSKQECKLFLNEYHLQNSCNGQIIRYGLYHNNELIQIMTFGKPRYNKSHEWELLRLCTHCNYRVIGGSEKLFKHFLKELNPKSIISYCDNSKFSGTVYERLGMELKSAGNATKIWSKGIEKITNNLLNQRGFDQLFKTNYGKGTSNRDLMIKHEWREVYDCGQSVWEWFSK